MMWAGRGNEGTGASVGVSNPAARKVEPAPGAPEPCETLRHGGSMQRGCGEKCTASNGAALDVPCKVIEVAYVHPTSLPHGCVETCSTRLRRSNELVRARLACGSLGFVSRPP